jgi:hypothetical protein
MQKTAENRDFFDGASFLPDEPIPNYGNFRQFSVSVFGRSWPLSVSGNGARLGALAQEIGQSSAGRL